MPDEPVKVRGVPAAIEALCHAGCSHGVNGPSGDGRSLG